MNKGESLKIELTTNISDVLVDAISDAINKISNKGGFNHAFFGEFVDLAFVSVEGLSKWFESYPSVMFKVDSSISTGCPNITRECFELKSAEAFQVVKNGVSFMLPPNTILLAGVAVIRQSPQMEVPCCGSEDEPATVYDEDRNPAMAVPLSLCLDDIITNPPASEGDKPFTKYMVLFSSKQGVDIRMVEAAETYGVGYNLLHIKVDVGGIACATDIECHFPSLKEKVSFVIFGDLCEPEFKYNTTDFNQYEVLHARLFADDSVALFTIGNKSAE